MRDRYHMEYVNAEVSVIIDDKDERELPAETLCHRLNFETRMHHKYKKECVKFHQALLDSIDSERTELGRSVLKQFAESVGVTFYP